MWFVYRTDRFNMSISQVSLGISKSVTFFTDMYIWSCVCRPNLPIIYVLVVKTSPKTGSIVPSNNFLLPKFKDHWCPPHHRTSYSNSHWWWVYGSQPTRICPKPICAVCVSGETCGKYGRGWHSRFSAQSTKFSTLHSNLPQIPTLLRAYVDISSCIAVRTSSPFTWPREISIISLYPTLR